MNNLCLDLSLWCYWCWRGATLICFLLLLRILACLHCLVCLLWSLSVSLRSIVVLLSDRCLLVGEISLFFVWGIQQVLFVRNLIIWSRGTSVMCWKLVAIGMHWWPKQVVDWHDVLTVWWGDLSAWDIARRSWVVLPLCVCVVQSNQLYFWVTRTAVDVKNPLKF